mgnify:FL=1
MEGPGEVRGARKDALSEGSHGVWSGRRMQNRTAQREEKRREEFSVCTEKGRGGLAEENIHTCHTIPYHTPSMWHARHWEIACIARMPLVRRKYIGLNVIDNDDMGIALPYNDEMEMPKRGYNLPSFKDKSGVSFH